MLFSSALSVLYKTREFHTRKPFKSSYLCNCCIYQEAPQQTGPKYAENEMIIEIIENGDYFNI